MLIEGGKQVDAKLRANKGYGIGKTPEVLTENEYISHGHDEANVNKKHET
jgi:hypothetical protein